MKRPPLKWDEQPWGALWAVTLIVMGGAIFAALFEGWSFSEAVVAGVLIGPGWLAFVTVIGLLAWMLGLVGKDDGAP